MFGIWCGKDATVTIVEDFSIAFLRIRKDMIASILKHRLYGTVGVVYGLGIDFDARAVYCIKHPETGKLSYNEAVGQEHLEKHSEDSCSLGEDGSMTYRMYDERSTRWCWRRKSTWRTLERRHRWILP